MPLAELCDLPSRFHNTVWVDGVERRDTAAAQSPGGESLDGEWAKGLVSGAVNQQEESSEGFLFFQTWE